MSSNRSCLFKKWIQITSFLNGTFNLNPGSKKIPCCGDSCQGNWEKQQLSHVFAHAGSYSDVQIPKWCHQNGPTQFPFLHSLKYSKPENLPSLPFCNFSPRNILFLELSSATCTNHKLWPWVQGRKTWIYRLDHHIPDQCSEYCYFYFPSQGVIFKTTFSHNLYKNCCVSF